MIKVNWREIKRLASELKDQRWNKDQPILIDVYTKKPDSDRPAKTTVRSSIQKWQGDLYEIESRRSVLAVSIRDPRGRTIWRVEKRPEVSEVIPLHGHDHVVEDYATMDGVERQVWSKIMTACIIDDIENESINDD